MNVATYFLVMSSIAAAAAAPRSVRTEEEGDDAFSAATAAATLNERRRTSRQTSGGSVLCLGDSFVTTLVTAILDKNRQEIRRRAPTYLGGCQEYGLFKICNGRAVNLDLILFPGGFATECSEKWAKFVVPMFLQDFTFTFDISYPLSIGRGSLIAAWQLFVANCTAYWPLNKYETGDSPQIDKLEIFEQKQPYIKVKGFFPVSTAFQLIFELAVRSFPEFTNQLFAYLLRELLQQWIDDYHTSLPF